MPHIRVRGASLEHVAKLSENLGAEMGPLVGTSPDNFTVECVKTHFFSNGVGDAGYPFIEVLWFDRPHEIKQRCAEYLTAKLKSIVGGPTAPDVAVIFQPLEKSNYFENSRSF